VSQNEGRVTGLSGWEVFRRLTHAEGIQNVLTFNHYLNRCDE